MQRRAPSGRARVNIWSQIVPGYPGNLFDSENALDRYSANRAPFLDRLIRNFEAPRELGDAAGRIDRLAGDSLSNSFAVFHALQNYNQ